jgi:hypothetical protein
MSESKTSEKRIAAVERKRQALELRKAGLTYQEIADRLGYDGPSGAYATIRAALRALVKEPAEELRDLEVARLDALLSGIWLEARKGNVSKIDRVLKIMERRATLLGLDAPKLTKDVSDTRKVAEEIAAEIGKPELVAQIERDLLISQEAR